MVPTVAVYNPKGGVGKTSLVCQLAGTLFDVGHRVLMVDLDPLAGLSILVLTERRLTGEFWVDGHSRTVYGAVVPLFRGVGDVRPAHVEIINERLALLVGDPKLADVEDDVSFEWRRCFSGDARGLRVTTVFWRMIREAVERWGADLVMIDVGPGVGAINRAALIASSHVVVPVATDAKSLYALKVMDQTLASWRQSWEHGVLPCPHEIGEMPSGKMELLGYMLMGTSAADGEDWDSTIRSYMPAVRHITSPQEIAQLLKLEK